MIPENYIAIFEAYTSGAINEKERLEFEARLSYDSDFKDHFKKYQSLEADIKKHFHRESLKNKLKEADISIDQGKANIPSQSHRIRNISIGIAAGISLLFGIYYNTQNSQNRTSELWPYEDGLPVQMGNSNSYHSAMNAFKLEEWIQAIERFGTFDSDTASYFTALSHYELGNHDQSASFLLNIPEASIFYEDASVRLALLYVRKGNTIKARKSLEAILTDRNHKYYVLAQRILKEIK
jgi:hypothetical protein